MKARRESKVNVTHRLHYLLGLLLFFPFSNVRGKDRFSFHPHPCSDSTSARMCEAIKYAGNCGRVLCARGKCVCVCVSEGGGITEEASVSLRGIGGAGCWERVEMTNGLLCN